MSTYSSDFRQRARIALQTAGYPTQRSALRTVSHLLGIPRHTLKRWFTQPDPPTLTPPALLQPILTHEIHRILTSLDHKRESATYTELSHALSRLVDVLHNLEP